MQHISVNNKIFPKEFLGIAQPPRQLFVEGDLAALMDKPRVAVVGSRKASPYGRIVTERLVQALSAYGVVIVSGLAFGVDAIAQQTAIDSGGRMIAVLPTGLDEISPASHRGLAKQILASGGVLLSEYPPKTISFKGNFIARNRLIAGLAQAVLITEAAVGSGSLHTANFAIEQGKEVMVVPGPITSLTSAGCNNLIKCGAAVITGPEDVFNILKIGITDLGIREIVAANPEEYIILTLIKNGVKDGDELQNRCGMPAADYARLMSLLEISGKIKVLGGNQWDLA